MPSLVEIIIAAQDRTGPAFQSASGGMRVLGVEVERTGARVTTLTSRLALQQRSLALLERQLSETTAAHGIGSVAATRQQIAYDRLALSIRKTEIELDRLHDEQREGGGAAFQLAAGMGGGGVSGATTVIGGLTQAVGALGITLGATEIARFGVDAIQASNRLEITESTIRALTGTTEHYNEVLMLGRQQQSMFGGSMNDVLVGLQGLIPLSRNAGVALADLNLVSQQLAASSPEQGIQGAAFAIREFLSATDATALRSLADRFELPKTALQEIKASSSDASEQIRQLTALMNQQGFTAATLGSRAQTTAKAYQDLGVAWSNARDAGGSLLARAFEPMAVQLAGVLSGNLGEVMRGGNLALGYSKQDATTRTAQALGSIGMAAPQQLAPIATPQATGRAPTVINQYTIHGSLVTERQVAEATRRTNQQKANRNGMSSR